jgi:hypothetical protein
MVIHFASGKSSSIEVRKKKEKKRKETNLIILYHVTLNEFLLYHDINHQIKAIDSLYKAFQEV